MKRTAVILICLFIQQVGFSQMLLGRVDSMQLPSLKMHYQDELTFDKPSNPSDWQDEKKGLNVSFGSTERAYFRTEVPVKKETVLWDATGWKGERLNVQVLVWSPDSLEQVRFQMGDLTASNGKSISRNNFNLNMVRYVLGNYPYGDREAVCGSTPFKDGFLMPDRFESFDRFDLPGQTIRPVWVSLDLPAGTEPGVYSGKIKVISSKEVKDLDVKIKVQNKVLPKPADWSYRLDLWQNPWAVAWSNKLVPWSAEHKQLLKKHLKLYADAGGKYITTYGVHSPWADNSYMIEGGMIEWTKSKSGSWKFDYTIFDTYVELAIEAGVDKAITIYTAVPWGDRFRYKEEATGNYVYESWAPNSDKYSTNWNVFLTDLKKHLLKKGWLQKTFIGINESEMKQTLAAIKVIKKHSPDWKITYAGNWHKELDTLLDDYSFLYGNEPTAEELKQRKARGDFSTFYVCCNPAKPNNFVFSPPIEGRWISWYSAAFGYDGWLRWAYDAWPEDPNRDARFGSWPSGDCYMIYPGAVSCVRFEKMREGIADFEKLRILKAQAAVSKDKNVQRLVDELNQHLKAFTMEKAFDEAKITSDVDKGRNLVDLLSDLLSGSKAK
jgi:hypothetical protein